MHLLAFTIGSSIFEFSKTSHGNSNNALALQFTAMRYAGLTSLFFLKLILIRVPVARVRTSCSGCPRSLAPAAGLFPFGGLQAAALSTCGARLYFVSG